MGSTLMGRYLAGSMLLTALLLATVASAVFAVAPGTAAFERTWTRTDGPVLDGDVSRTWMWGPEAFTEAMSEPYAEAPGGERTVQYFDKSRMEDNSWRNASAPWDVTNGLLATELTSGRMQVGDASSVDRSPPVINVAGDPDDPTGPTYRTFASLLDAPPAAEGAVITQTVDREGNIENNSDLAVHNVLADEYVALTDHRIAGPFWAFMNSEGLVHEDGQLVMDELFISPFYATGLPISEAYWAQVKVAGTERWVLIQVFERRVLTYTPGNPEGFVVEAGNVGQHYYRWRYELSLAPAGDYGDAPDGAATGYPTQFAQTGNFPTLFASGGAHTLDLSQASLGPTASAEIDADDPADPDGVTNLINTDADDGVSGLTMLLTQIPPPAELAVRVEGASGGDFFLNVLIDLDMDGAWGGTAAGGEPEWVVENYEVTIAAGETATITPPPFAFANGNRLPDGAWMRIALTSEAVTADDWDGSGAFAAGEIEDHVILLPEKEVPMLVPYCNGPYDFNGAIQLDFECTVTNHAPWAGTFDWEMIGPLRGDVDVAPKVNLAPVPIGAAPGPGDVVTLDFTATRGDDLPSTWRFKVTAIDPPTEVFPGGVRLGFPESSEVDIEFTGDAEPPEPQKSAEQEVVSPGQWIDYTITVPANPGLDAPAEGQIIDPINADFFIGMPDPVLSAITCTIGECYYDPAENNVVWVGTFTPGATVTMSFAVLVPEGLLPDEYPEEYLNCVHGFDGLEAFSGVCTSTPVALPEM